MYLTLPTLSTLSDYVILVPLVHSALGEMVNLVGLDLRFTELDDEWPMAVELARNMCSLFEAIPSERLTTIVMDLHIKRLSGMQVFDWERLEMALSRPNYSNLEILKVENVPEGLKKDIEGYFDANMGSELRSKIILA